MGGETLVLQQARWKTFLALAGAVALFVAGAWAIAHPEETRRFSSEQIVLIGWACAVFSVFLMVVGIGKLFRPSAVFLSPEGFEIGGVWRTPLVRWDAVDRFFVGKVRLNRFVGYALAPVVDPQALHHPRTLPAYLGRSPEEVCGLMEDWRRRYAPCPPASDSDRGVQHSVSGVILNGE